MGAAIERIAAERRRRHVRCADAHQQLALGRELAHRVALVIGQIEQVVGTDGGAVRIGESDVLTPRSQKLPIAVEDDDRMRAAGEYIDVVLAVHAHRRGVAAIGHAGRQLTPAFENPVTIAALAEDHGLRRTRTCRGQQCTRTGQYPGTQ